MTVETRRVYTFDNGEERMSDLSLSFEERQQLADQMEVELDDVTPETIMGYAEELRELGHGAEAARVIGYLGHSAGDADDGDEDSLYRSLAATLDLPDDSARSFEQDDAETDEDRLYADLRDRGYVP